MANKKITELDAITTLASTDVVPVVDVSADTTNKITAANLFRTLPDGTAAAPALAFSSDAANGVYLAGTDTVGISTGGTQRVTVDGSGNVTISGDLTVNGATTTVESTTVTIDDKNIELGSVASPSNTTADGGGITLKGATDKTIKWINSTNYWTFSTGIEVGGHLQIDANNEIRVGTSQDLKIYHSSNISTIKDSYGDLRIMGDTIRIQRAAGGENYIYATEGGKVSLYYDGSEKLQTKSDGVDITGELLCDSAGIGTSSPLAKCHIARGSDDDSILYITGADTSSEYVALGVGANYGMLTAGGSGSTSTDLIFRTTNSGTEAERLRITSSGAVGIGTSSPTDVLTVAGTNAFIKVDRSNGNPGIDFRYNGSTTNRGLIDVTSDGALRIAAGGNTERMRITSAGNVAIGSTSATEKLSVNGKLHITNDIILAQTNGRFDFDNGNSSGALRFHSTSGNAERMRITSAGNVGIKTTNPQAPFVVSNNGADGIEMGYSSGSSSNYFQSYNRSSSAFAQLDVVGNPLVFKTGSSAAERVRIDSSGDVEIMQGKNLTWVYQGGSTHRARIRAESSDVLIFENGSGNTERMRIASNGNVGINNSSPQSKLDVNGDVRIATGSALLSTSSGGTVQIQGGATYPGGNILLSGGSGTDDIRFRTTGASQTSTERMRVNNSGVSVSSGNLSMHSGGRIFVGNGGNAVNPMFANVSDTNTGIAFPAADTMLFTTGGSERLRITSTGAWAIEGASNYGTSGQVLTSNGNDAPTWQDATGWWWWWCQRH